MDEQPGTAKVLDAEPVPHATPLVTGPGRDAGDELNQQIAGALGELIRHAHDLGQGIALTDEQFYAEMARRREKLKLSPNDVLIGCPLCNGDPIPPPAARKQGASTGGGGQ